MQVLKSEGRSAAILAVGADKIASAAFEWANQRPVLTAIGQVDVGYDPPMSGGVLLFETYPSAFVRLNYPSFSGYKTLKEAKEGDELAQDQPAERQARHDLLDAIRTDYSIDTTHCASALETACATSASDAFDGFLSAIAAWDYLKWRFQQATTIRMSSPAELLGVQRAEVEKPRIKKEGWFLVRLPMGLVCSHDEADQKGEDKDRGPSGENRQGEG